MALAGSVIETRDVAILKEMYVAGVFSGGSDTDAAAAFIREQLKESAD